MKNKTRSSLQQPTVLGPRKAHDASEPSVLGPVYRRDRLWIPIYRAALSHLLDAELAEAMANAALDEFDKRIQASDG